MNVNVQKNAFFRAKKQPVSYFTGCFLIKNESFPDYFGSISTLLSKLRQMLTHSRRMIMYFRASVRLVDS